MVVLYSMPRRLYDIRCMDTFDIPLGQNFDPTALPELIERAVAQDGLLASRLAEPDARALRNPPRRSCLR